MFELENLTGRVWAEINLDALVSNYRQIRKLIAPETKVMATVKANAYGHGALQCARTLLEAGADYLGVAALEEALELRAGGITAPVLILGYIPPHQAHCLVEQSITATVYTAELAQALSRAAVKLQKPCRIHLKINTGMERIGFQPEDTEQMLAVCRLPGLIPEGIFSHLACADSPDSSGVHTQYQVFMSVLNALGCAGLTFPLRHLLNSAGIFDFPEYQLDMVRPGIVLYGYYPSAYIHTMRAPLQPVLSLKARVVHLHTVPPATGISYGWSYVTCRSTMVATIPVGYADGYSRRLSNTGEVLAGGRRVPILGKICMDQCMIDVSSVNTIHVGDEIILIGTQGEEAITADTLAKKTDTISYEILCATGKRVPRIYKRGGDIVGVLNGFSETKA